MRKNLNQLISHLKTVNRSTKALYVMLLVTFLFLMSLALAPLHTMSEINKFVKNDTIFVSKFDQAYNHSDLTAILKEKTFKEALLKLSENDSIQLVINLKDSTICLYIKGVNIHQSNIIKYNTDAFFEKFSIMQYIKIFQQPLKIAEQYASFEKEPIVVRQAPKNELEAALNTQEPDVIFQKPTFAQFSLEHGISIILEQENNPTFYDKWIKHRFYNHLFLKKLTVQMGRFVFFKKQIYHPEIHIKIKKDDLQAVYRALPQNAYVVLYVN